MSKRDLIHALVKSSQTNNEQRYISYINKDINNDIHNEINKIRMQLFEMSPYLNKGTLKDIRKLLYDIEHQKKIKNKQNRKK